MAVISGGRVIEGARRNEFTQSFTKAGAATSGASGDFLGTAAVGDLLTDTTNGVLYICTNAGGTPANFAWTKVGTQT